MTTEKQERITDAELLDATGRREALKRQTLVANAAASKAEAMDAENKLVTDDLRVKYNLQVGDAIRDDGVITRKKAPAASAGGSGD